MKAWHHYLLIVVCFVLVVGFVAYTFITNPTPSEVALFQLGILITGLYSSYIFGRNSAQAGAREVIRPHARSAFRRVTALYNSLFSLSIKIEELKGEEPDHRLDLIQALVDEHYQTGKDAMEDWRDIVPEEVEEIERKSTRR